MLKWNLSQFEIVQSFANFVTINHNSNHPHLISNCMVFWENENFVTILCHTIYPIPLRAYISIEIPQSHFELNDNLNHSLVIAMLYNSTLIPEEEWVSSNAYTFIDRLEDLEQAHPEFTSIDIHNWESPSTPATPAKSLHAYFCCKIDCSTAVRRSTRGLNDGESSFALL